MLNRIQQTLSVMKTNIVFKSPFVGTVSLLCIFTGGVKIASAQSINSPLNGLFTPTQAQQFFEAGRRKFETEIGFYRPQDILELEDPIIDKNYKIEQMKPVSEPETKTERLQNLETS